MLKPDDVFAGRFRLVLPLGEREGSAVWHAVDGQGDRPVALAVAFPDGDRVPRFLERARKASGIQHANVARVLAVGEAEDGRGFAAMELLKGQSLAERLGEQPPLTLSELLTIAAQGLEGLAALHEAGLVHGDLEPGNIFLASQEGQAGVVAKLIGIVCSRAEERTCAEAVDPDDEALLRSLAYCSPEQAREETAIGTSTDIYSFGVLLFEAISGRLPHLGRTGAEIRAAVRGGSAPTLYSERSDLPVPLSRAIQRAMAAQPSSRHANAKAMAQALAGSVMMAPEAVKKSPLPGGRSGVHRASQLGLRAVTDEEAPRPVAVSPAPSPPDAAAIRRAAKRTLVGMPGPLDLDPPAPAPEPTDGRREEPAKPAAEASPSPKPFKALSDPLPKAPSTSAAGAEGPVAAPPGSVPAPAPFRRREGEDAGKRGPKLAEAERAPDEPAAADNEEVEKPAAAAADDTEAEKPAERDDERVEKPAERDDGEAEKPAERDGEEGATEEIRLTDLEDVLEAPAKPPPPPPPPATATASESKKPPSAAATVPGDVDAAPDAREPGSPDDGAEAEPPEIDIPTTPEALEEQPPEPSAARPETGGPDPEHDVDGEVDEEDEPPLRARRGRVWVALGAGTAVLTATVLVVVFRGEAPETAGAGAVADRAGGGEPSESTAAPVDASTSDDGSGASADAAPAEAGASDDGGIAPAEAGEPAVEPTSHSVSLRGLLEGARVRLNGARVHGETVEVPADGREHTIEVAVDGYRRWFRPVTPTGPLVLDVTMTRLTSTGPRPPTKTGTTSRPPQKRPGGPALVRDPGF